MGRPPLGNKATQVRLPPELGERIDAVMGGPNRRAKFLREAAEIELDRREGVMARGEGGELKRREQPKP